MKKYLVTAVVVIALAIYAFLYLSIELELKNVIERPGVNANGLINASLKIRSIMTIQLVVFIGTCLLGLFSQFKRNK